ncbi:FAD-binding protein [Anthocerotibacter panamensis]|uniref:FAD-binding protein n=1 Tax=Anthocerotibacter panamensis TaxID=2857077 RepID=UPI001C4034F6|nr:FAD-binding protein [Anthocerotibacter panamensis]
MAPISVLTTRNLSFFRTLNRFAHYGEIHTLAEFEEYCHWARANRIPIYILGNGSNTFFARRTVQTLVLKNCLERTIVALPGERLEVSSSALVADVLKYCFSHGLDSFYYLASVPATIGGALAMNAGRGKTHGLTIFDYVESVTFYAEGQVHTLMAQQIPLEYRQTPFTGQHTRLILKAVFKFPPRELPTNPIYTRREWAKLHQDYAAPNCGSIFKTYAGPLLRPLKGLRLGQACYSPKTENWILNNADHGLPILLLIWMAQGVHRLLGMRAILEIILVR